MHLSAIIFGNFGHFTDLGAHVTGPSGLTLLLLWATVFLAAGVTYAQRTEGRSSVRGFVRHLLPESIFRHASPRADLLFWLSRRLMMPLLIVPLSISTAAAGYAVHRGLELLVGPTPTALPPPGPGEVVLFAFTLLLAYDISYYIYHYMQHKIPMLWELHKVHHSAEVMVGVTKDRIHPLDDLMNRWWDGIIPGAVYGVWLCFMTPVDVTLFGINVFVLRNILMMDFVRHTHLKLSFGRWLNAIILCPHYHQLHHSAAPKHYDKNFGLMLSIWDRMFGTLVIPEPDEDFIFGLASHEQDQYQSLVRLYFLPLRKIAAMVRVSLPSMGRAAIGNAPGKAAGALQPPTGV